MKSKDQQLLEEAYTKINESCISDKFVARFDDIQKRYGKTGDRNAWIDTSLKLLEDIIEMKRKDINKKKAAKKAVDAEHKDYEAYWNKREEEGSTGF
jgi:hypothetical protein